MLTKGDYLIPEWPAPANVRGFVSTRSNSPVQGMPPTQGVATEQAQRLRRAWLSPWQTRLMAEWGWQQPPCWATQVHGTTVIPADSPYGTEADGVWTDQSNRPCTVLTADCLPVMFCNLAGTKVAAAHAGWRGLVGGVLENTVATLNEPVEQIMAWLGPAISQRVFEVGPEVRDAFISHDRKAQQAFVAGTGDRWFADLYQLARLRLQALGIDAIYGGDQYCTVTETERFHSYRRDGSESGRLLTAVWLTP